MCSSYKLMLVVIFWARLRAVDGSNTGCPYTALESGHFHKVHDGTCYLFVNKERYWESAKASCQKMGGEMLAVDNYSTMRFVRSVLNSQELGWNKRGVWLGARYSGGRWRWTTGEQMGYANWASGEPSKILGLFSVEDCALMRREDNWRWHDYICGSMKYHFNYICQFPVEDYTSTTTTTTTSTTSSTTTVAPSFKPGQSSKKGHFLDRGEGGKPRNHGRHQRPGQRGEDREDKGGEGVNYMQNGNSNPPYDVHEGARGYPYDRRPAFNDRGYNEVHPTSHFPDNTNMTILTIILVAGGLVLLILVMIFLIIRKRYSYKKALAQPTVHFENRNYNHTHSGSSHSGSSHTTIPLPPPPAPHTFHRPSAPPVPPRPLATLLPRPSAATRLPPYPTAPYVPHSRPCSDMYLTPVEIGGGGGGGIYEEVQVPTSTTAGAGITTNLTHTPARSVDALGVCGGTFPQEHEDSATVPLISSSGALWGQSEESLHSMSGSLTMKTSSIHNDYVDMNGALVLPARSNATTAGEASSSRVNEGLELDPEPSSKDSDPKSELSLEDTDADRAVAPAEGKQAHTSNYSNLMTTSQERCENLYAQLH